MEEIHKKGYEIIRELASGGEGQVYLCKKDGELFALKVTLRLCAEQIETLERIQRLGGEYFPELREIFHDEHNTYLARIYVEGYTLAEEIARSGGFAFVRAKGIVRSLCGGLRLLHGAQPEPIIYRDLKPENIIITNSGNVRIIDFGIARRYKPDASRDTRPAGTAGYTAPEILSGFQSDTRSDVFSLGVILYEMLSGRRMRQPPYQIRPLKENAPYLPNGLDAIIRRATQPRPIDRYESVDAFWSALESVGKRKKRRGWFISCGILCAVLIGFGIRHAIHNLPDRAADASSDATGEPNVTVRNTPAVEEIEDPYLGRNIETVCAELAERNFYPAITGKTSAAQAGEILEWEQNDVTGMLFTVSIGPAVERVAFTDEALGRAVRKALGLSEEAVVSSIAMASLTTLNASGLGIRTLDGLEYAENLTQLELSGNEITDLSPISTLGRLETLKLNDNNLDDISTLARLRYIQTLSCDGNAITSILALDGIDLRVLSLADNQITDISPLYRSFNLSLLNISRNPVSDMSVLSDLQKLEALDLSGVPLNDYTPLFNCTGLKTVALGGDNAENTELAELLLEAGISVSLSVTELND